MTGTGTNDAGGPHSIAPKTSEEIARTLRLAQNARLLRACRARS